MAKQTINVGTTTNDGTGDTLRTGAIKINQNFDELYSVTDNIFSGDYNDLTNKPSLFNGAYASLTGKPTIPTDISQLTDNSELLVYNIPVATSNSLGGIKIGSGLSISQTGVLTGFSGNYEDLSNAPSLFSGNYNELSNKPERTIVSVTSTAVANGSLVNATIVGFKGYVIYKIEVTCGAWVRIYTDVASRTADATRLITDPIPDSDSGIIAEVSTTGPQTIKFTPAIYGFNNEPIVNSNIPIAITNNSGQSTYVTVLLTVLPMEV